MSPGLAEIHTQTVNTLKLSLGMILAAVALGVLAGCAGVQVAFACLKQSALPSDSQRFTRIL